VARRIVVLDSGVLGLALFPSGGSSNWRCLSWIRALQRDGVTIVVPEVIDYELRREFLRLRRVDVIANLERLITLFHYEPLSTDAMRLAARLWAETRQRGRPTADHQRLDVDVILAAQARVFAERDGAPVIVATTNVKHFSHFVPAETWETIGPD
jgi:predicted nucleic acid-binding protein